LRDNDPEFRAATVILTGSNATALTEAAGSLAGRRGRGKQLDRTLLPMGFKPFISILSDQKLPKVEGTGLTLTELHSAQAHKSYEAMIPWLDTFTRFWGLYLLYGGFPRMVANVKAGKRIDDSFISDLFDVVSGDAFKNSRLSTVEEMQLLERLWFSMAAPVNLSAIAKELDVSVDTIKRHTEYLRDAFLLSSCPQKDERRWVPKKGSQTKLYAIDPAIARLPHLLNSLRRDIDPTVMSEMQLFNILRRRLELSSSAGNDAPLFYYRSLSNHEIDFASERLGGVAIESKYIESGEWKAESRALQNSGWKGIVATRNVLDIDPEANTWAVPTSMLAYLLEVTL
jgi:predicted AAA+ superfamily ATPase